MLFRKAILIIHGFAGGTYDEEDLANYLELNKNFDVFQFTLPGHDRNLSKAKYKDWINSSEDKLKWLIKEGYKNIYLIGHSMGGVIACYLAKYNEVKKIVLAAPAFQYLDVKNDDLNITNSFKITPKIMETYGKDEIISRFLKLNMSTLKEFMTLVKEYYKSPSDITCPILIIQGKNDNLVPLTSSSYVYNSVKSNIKKLVYVDGVTHDVFRSKRNDEIFELVEQFFSHGLKGGIYTI